MIVLYEIIIESTSFEVEKMLISKQCILFHM